MVNWTLIAIIALIAIGILIISHFAAFRRGYRKGIRVATERIEKAKDERLNKNGRLKKAKVTDVKIEKNKRRYTVKAKYYSNSSEKTYYFEETFPFPKNATNRYHPRTTTGDMVDVQVIFHPVPLYRIKPK